MNKFFIFINVPDADHELPKMSGPYPTQVAAIKELEALRDESNAEDVIDDSLDSDTVPNITICHAGCGLPMQYYVLEPYDKLYKAAESFDL